jgi:head-tail adaptor
MAIGQYRHRVTLEAPSTSVPDGDGGYTTTYAPLDPPEWDCAIESVSARDLEAIGERPGAGTVTTQASHAVTGRYHPGITTATRIGFNGRVFEVTSVRNIDERDITLRLLALELVP